MDATKIQPEEVRAITDAALRLERAVANPTSYRETDMRVAWDRLQTVLRVIEGAER